MFEKLKAFFRPKLAKVAPKRFGYLVTFDNEEHQSLGVIKTVYIKRIGYTEYRHTFAPSNEILQFLEQYPGSVSVDEVRAVDFVDLHTMFMGTSRDYGKVTFAFPDPAYALMFRLRFLCPCL